MPEPIRFTALDGVEYRVLDAHFTKGKLLVADPPAPWATSRVFRPRKGYKRLYRLKDAADRATDPATLKRQLQMAEYLPTQPVHESIRDPR